MDYFGGTGNGESLTLTEMIECDMRSNFNEHMGSGDVLGAQTQNLDPSLAVSVSLDFSSHHQDHGAMASSAGGMDLLDGDSKLKDWIQNVSSMDFLKTENTDPNLMVDPQTGVPIQHQQNHHNVAVSSVVTSSASSLSTADAAQTVVSPNQVINIEPTSLDHLGVPVGGDMDSPASHQFVSMSAVQPQSPQPHSPIYVTQQHSQQHSSTLRQHLQNTLQQHHQAQAAFHGLTSQFSPHKVTGEDVGQKVYPKPVYSYSCLIAMALKNSETGCLPVSDIYSFMTENFPYFKTAPDGWKNSVRHNLSLNKCFEKIENPKSNGNTRKGCLWAMNPAKIEKMEDEIAKWRKKDPIAIKRSMAKPEVLDLLEKGQGGCRSPHHTGIGSTPSTPTHNNNNNNTKTSIHIVNSPGPQVIPTITTVNANASILELKPFKMEGIKLEDLNGISGLSSEDLNLLDNSLDPALSDLALQNGLFDDLGSEGINLDDLPISSSPLSFNFASPGLVTTSANNLYTSSGAAAPVSVKEEPGTVNSIQGNFVSYANCNTGVPTSAPSTPTSGSFQISRTVSAQT